MSPTLALLGSGEFEDWHDEVDAWLLERASGDGTVLIVPTASAPEGDEVFGRWAAAGIAHYERLSVPVEVLEVRTGEDANRGDLAERVGRASIVFVSGGNPSYAAATFAGSVVWRAVAAGLSDGRAYAGCSAGVACLTDPTYDTTASGLGDIGRRVSGSFRACSSDRTGTSWTRGSPARAPRSRRPPRRAAWCSSGSTSARR